MAHPTQGARHSDSLPRPAARSALAGRGTNVSLYLLGGPAYSFSQFFKASILFFQASATIIPTLFIALAFTSKALAADSYVLGAKNLDKEGYGSTIAILLLPLSSEAVALATLAANRPTPVATIWVLVGIATMVAYLALAITAPFRKGFDDRPGRTVFWGGGAIVLVFLLSKAILQSL